MNDAEKFTSAFRYAVIESPSRIAPERAEELLNDIFSGQQCEVEFTNGQANFFADVGSSKIEVRYSALLSLWATARASLQLAAAIGEARRTGIQTLNSEPGSPVHEAFRLVQCAQV